MPKTQYMTVAPVTRFIHIFYYLLFLCLPGHPHWDSTRSTQNTLIADTQTTKSIPLSQIPKRVSQALQCLDLCSKTPET